MNQFCLVQAVDRFSQRVVVAVAPTANRRFDARFGQAFAVSDTQILLASIGVMDQSSIVTGLASIQRLFKRIQNEISGHR